MTYVYKVSIDTWLPDNKTERIIQMRLVMPMDKATIPLIAAAQRVPVEEVRNVLEQVHLYRPKGTKVTIVCEQCGAQVTKRDVRARFCNSTCRKNAQYARRAHAQG